MKKRKKDWQANHVIIREAVVEGIKKNHRKPTITELAKVTGMSTSTIYTHMKGFDVESLVERNKEYRYLSEDVIGATYRSALKGDVRAQRLWFEMFEGMNQNGLLMSGSGEKVKELKITFGNDE